MTILPARNESSQARSQPISGQSLICSISSRDHGIDGHIDLVGPNGGALLNQTLLVQSKASDQPFPSETDQSFRYICDDRDLDLWLSGNAPVILIFSHPAQAEAWWVDCTQHPGRAWTPGLGTAVKASGVIEGRK